MPKSPAFTEVFSTSYGCVYQCDSQRCFWLRFNNELTCYPVADFLRLKSAIDQVNLDIMASDPDPACDLEIITWCNAQRCYVLTLSEVIRLKELLVGAKVMLELNSILHERLVEMKSGETAQEQVIR